MTVGMGHEFISFLGGGVEGDRMIDAIADGKGDFLICTVDRARRSKHQMRNLMTERMAKPMAEGSDDDDIPQGYS